MDNKFILEKNYTIPADIFREGFRAYQKKYVYPKSYLFMAIFLVLAANFVYGAVKAPDNILAYLMIVVCLALVFREWYNPRKMRMAFLDTLHEMGKQEYKISIGKDSIEFSTIEHEKVENFVETTEDDDTTEDFEPVSPSKIPIGENLNIIEYDRFFLVIDGKVMFYIVPKENFTESELDVIRSLNKN